MTHRIAQLLFAIAVLGIAAPLRAMPNPPLQSGEQLRYRVSWAVVMGAGEIKVRADANPSNPNESKITTTTSTRGLARLALPFDATAESIFNLKSGRLETL